MSLIKMQNKKAMEIPGWIYVVGLIIGLLVILLIIWISAKSGQKATGLLDTIKGLL